MKINGFFSFLNLKQFAKTSEAHSNDHKIIMDQEQVSVN